MSSIREWADVCLDEMQVKLLEDKEVYGSRARNGVAAVAKLVGALRRRAANNTVYPNPSYHRQGEMACALLVLAREYPERYVSLMGAVVGTSSIVTLDGATKLEMILASLSDDHEFRLVKDSGGEYRVYHETNLPEEYGFVPLTCSRDLCEVAFDLLQQAGFEIDPSASPSA